MYIALLLFVALAHCQNVNNNDLNAYYNIFGTPEKVYDPCTMSNGQPGLCVPYYLCNSRDIITEDGAGLLDPRMPSVCGGGTICCMTTVLNKPNQPAPTIKKEGCGWSNPKGADMRTTGETNGDTKFGEFPWMVAILKLDPLGNQTANYKYNGGGSLIHPSAVLTAAHIVSTATEYKVRAGEWDTQSINEVYPYQDRKVASIAIHTDYIEDPYYYDIALLFLEKPVEMAPHIGVVCLPPPRERTDHGTRCVATGWGRKKFENKNELQVILKKVEVPVVEHSSCQNALRNTRLGFLFELHTSFMCAGGEKDIDVCVGDGGAPLSCPIPIDKDRYMQSGIVCWGIGCGQDGVPGVYVDVSNLRDWIDDKMNGKGYGPKSYTY